MEGEAGADALVRAVWARVLDQIGEAARELAACFEAVACARALPDPEALGTEPPGTAYKGRGGYYVEK